MSRAALQDALRPLPAEAAEEASPGEEVAGFGGLQFYKKNASFQVFLLGFTKKCQFPGAFVARLVALADVWCAAGFSLGLPKALGNSWWILEGPLGRLSWGSWRRLGKTLG